MVQLWYGYVNVIRGLHLEENSKLERKGKGGAGGFLRVISSQQIVSSMCVYRRIESRLILVY